MCIKRVPSQQSHSIIYPGANADKYDNIGVLNPNQMRRWDVLTKISQTIVKCRYIYWQHSLKAGFINTIFQALSVAVNSDCLISPELLHQLLGCHRHDKWDRRPVSVPCLSIDQRQVWSWPLLSSPSTISDGGFIGKQKLQKIKTELKMYVWCGYHLLSCCPHFVQLLRFRTEIFTGTADDVTEAAVDQGRFKKDKIFFSRWWTPGWVVGEPDSWP